MNYNRYKDCSPEYTIEKIQNFLKFLNIEYKESELNNPVPFIYSVSIECSSINIKSHGKGTTKEYCLASAYGELLEKLLNGVFKLRYVSPPEKNCVTNIFYDEMPYVISKDLKLLPQCIKEDLYNSYYESDGVYPSMEELISVYQNIYGGNVINAIPFYDVLNDRVINLPYNILDELSHSTGMSYGNTLEEAISQAICEIFERYASSTIIDRLLTPPEISLEYIKSVCPNFCDIIDFICNNGYEISFYDCSLGIGLPVVGLLIVDKNNSKYKINFGAHISFTIAVERCLTEVLQGFNKIEEVNFIEFTPNLTDNYKDFLYKRFRHNNGTVPIEFFKGTPSWEFKPWEYKFSDNKDIVRQLVDISLTISSNVYIRNNTCMGLTAVRVYIPKLSHYKNIFSVGKNTCISPIEKYNLENFEGVIINKDDLDSYERIIKNKFDFLEDRVKYSKNVLLSAIEYDKGNIISSIDYLRSDDNLPIFAKILLQILVLIEKQYPEDCIHSILLKFYNEDDIMFTYNLLSCHSLFEEILKIRKYCEYSKEYYQRIEMNVSEFISRYIQCMNDNKVQQYNIRELFR